MSLRPRRMFRFILAALFLGTAVAVPVAVTTAPPAEANACYTWKRVLRQGSTGDDVRHLQIRVAGYVGSEDFVVDGRFGPNTARAVRGFQSAKGLAVDGVAGPRTVGKIYEMQKADCTPPNFRWSEVDDVCYGGFPTPANGVSVATVRANLLQVMWRAQALRERLGNHPLRVTSAYRSRSCNNRVGGDPNSNHLSGKAIDIVPQNSGTTICRIASGARSTAFQKILGPGYPGHGDHAHLGIQNTRSWSASRCF